VNDDMEEDTPANGFGELFAGGSYIKNKQ